LIKINKKYTDNDDSEWSISYGDMMTILLCFFVILVAMSTIDDQKYGLLSDSVSNALGIHIERQKEKIIEVREKLGAIVQEEKLGEEIKIIPTLEGVAIQMSSNAIFSSGSAELTEKAKKLLEKLAQKIRPEPFGIVVEGHTDNVPLHKNSKYPSNWELSTARSSVVVRYMIDQSISPERLKAVGYADTLPLHPNIGPTGEPISENQSKNRRVVLVINPL